MIKIKKKGQNAKHSQEQGIEAVFNKATGFLATYKQQMVIAASIVAALFVIVAGYSLVRSSDERQASPLLAAAYESYTRSSGMPAADYPKALELFRGVQKKYSGTMSGAIAQYYIGNCLVELGRQDEALKEYQHFATKYSEDKYLLGLVYQRLGYLHNALGKQAEAVKAFEKSESLGGPGVATVELARLYENSGNLTESHKKLKTVQEKLGGTTWSVEAMGKLQKIETPKPVVK